MGRKKPTLGYWIAVNTFSVPSKNQENTEKFGLDRSIGHHRFFYRNLGLIELVLKFEATFLVRFLWISVTSLANSR